MERSRIVEKGLERGSHGLLAGVMLDMNLP